jgi:hemin uptake protein HemP
VPAGETLVEKRGASREGAAGRAPGGEPGTRVVDSATLLAGGSQLAIRHRETVYFLRETRFGKLILTK